MKERSFSMRSSVDRSLHRVLALLLVPLGLAGPATPALSAESWVELTPRVWLTQMKTLNEDDLAKSTVFVPMYGASLSLTPPPLPGLSVVVTGLYGTGTGDALYLNPVPLLPAPPYPVKSEVTRADIEGLIRYTIPETPFSLFAGPRYVRFDEDFILGGISWIEEQNRLIVIEAGLGAHASFGDSENHRIFVNLTSGVAFLDNSYASIVPGNVLFMNDDATDPILDVNAGYQYLMADRISLSLRYRAFFYFTDFVFFAANGARYTLSDVISFHGPEIGIGIRF